MELAPIKIPEIPLPFDIPVLMHPPIDHFMIALPVVVLLLEIINLFAKKRAIGVISFFLLLLTVVTAVAAYLTGTTDGKHAYDMLSQAGQADLKDHKTLGTYLMLISGVVLIFKLLSVMINRAMMKALFLIVLIFFVAGILKQGKEGGELVYKYGANVAPAKAYSDLMFTINDDMEDDDTIADLKEELSPETKDESAVKETKTESTAATESKTEAPVVEKVKSEEKVPATKAETPAAATTVDEHTTAEENVSTATEEKSAQAAETSEAPVSEAAPAVEVVPAAAEAQPEVVMH